MSASKKFDAFLNKADDAARGIQDWKSAVHSFNEQIKAQIEKEFGAKARCISKPIPRLLTNELPVDRPYELEDLDIILANQLLITVKAGNWRSTGNSVKLGCRDHFATLEWSGGGVGLSNWSLRTPRNPGQLAIQDINASPRDTVSLPESQGVPLDESTLGQIIEQLIPD